MKDIVDINQSWLMYEIPFLIQGKISRECFWALRDVNLKVKKGEVVGIVGENGSGKSTLLRLIAGILVPDRGKISVSERVAGLLELGAGFQPELSGEENVRLAEKLYCLPQDNIEQAYEKIINFANLGKFIYAPVKCYSQGMFVRLAFSIAVHMNADIFVIDDSLAVGDESFQRKCIEKILELKNHGKTMFIVAHDLNILKLLCNRVVLLKEGRILMDSAPDNVLPFYSQFFGSKEGVAVLGTNELKTVFNNGKLLLNRKEQILTACQGLFSSFQINDVWYNSHQVNWQKEMQDDGTVVMKSRIAPLGLEHKWTLKLDGVSGIRIDMEMERSSSLALQEAVIAIMISQAYTHWTSLSGSGRFIPITEDALTWQAVADTQSHDGCLCAASNPAQPEALPGIIFEVTDREEKYKGRIFNSDYFTQARILQFSTRELQNYERVQEGKMKYFSGRILLNHPDVSRFLDDKRKSMPLKEAFLKQEKNTLGIHIKKGCCIFNYRGQVFTKKPHAITHMKINDKLMSSLDAVWRFEREGMKVIGRGVWPGVPIEQIWQVELPGNMELCWTVYLEVKEAVRLNEAEARVFFPEFYNCFFTKFGRRDFPEEFKEYGLDILQRCVADGDITLSACEPAFPDTRLSFQKEKNTFAKIFNSSLAFRARIVTINNVLAEKNQSLGPGRYNCFTIKGNFSSENGVQAETEKKSFQKGRLKVTLQNGRGYVYWENINLTKSLGLYTALRVNSRWYESGSSAAWAIKTQQEDFVFKGQWLELPVTQEWQIKLKADNTIDCFIKMMVHEQLEVERLQTNIMLVEPYSTWEADGAKRDFPVFDGNTDDDWQILHSRPCGYAAVIAHSEDDRLPAVILKVKADGAKAQIRVLNSDLCHRGRVLQYVIPERQTIAPGEYNYFSGSIQLDVKGK